MLLLLPTNMRFEETRRYIVKLTLQRLGGRFPPVRRWEGDMVQLRVVLYHYAKQKSR